MRKIKLQGIGKVEFIMKKTLNKMDKDQIVQKLSTSKNYKTLYSKTIERIVEGAIRKNPKYAVNTAKNDLHKIWGAFFARRPRFVKLKRKYLKNTISNESDKKETILELLKIHSSTAERISYLNTFYKKIFEVTGYPKSILDIACGFNPLTIPWMDLSENTQYLAYDIDLEEVNFLNESFKLLNFPTNISAHPGDILIDEFPEADIVFLFKLIPLLEQQKKGSTIKVLNKLKAKYIIVSFPTKTLSGREVGMCNFYSEQFEETIGARRLEVGDRIHDARGKKQETGDKRQESRDKKQEAGILRQDASFENQETRSMKQEVGEVKLEAISDNHETTGKTFEIIKRIEFGYELVYIVSKNENRSSK